MNPVNISSRRVPLPNPALNMAQSPPMTDESTSNPKPRRTLKQFTAEYLIVFTIITASVTALSFFARQHHIFELMTHFKVLYFLSALFTTIGLLSLRRWYFGILSLLTLLVHAPGILVFYIPTESTQTSASPNLTILSANILSYNDDPSQFIDYVLETDPDILLLQEVSPRWLPHLAPLIESDYIYNHLIPQSDNFGMATLSKLPLNNIEGIHISPDYPWSIQASLTINKRDVTILNFHPLPPGDAYNAVLRDKHLQIAKQFALDQEDLCIIAGDFNVRDGDILDSRIPQFGEDCHADNLANRLGGFQDSSAAHLPGAPLPSCFIRCLEA